MSNPFQNFLSGAPAITGTKRTYKSYAHATGLYVDGNRMPRLPKLGFIYFVQFSLNDQVNQDIPADLRNDLGFLAKKADLPKFKITTQTLNQYNRKTNVQTKLTYDPINIEFHDDNSEITNTLWRKYFQYYYADARYNHLGDFTKEFKGDTKYLDNTTYGYAPDPQKNKPFFKAIDIYVLHQGNFSQYSIANPIITGWDHDSVDQTQTTKTLQNKLTVAYDSVTYYQGVIKQDPLNDFVFDSRYYDTDVNLPNGNTPHAEVGTPTIIPTYPTPQPTALSSSQLDKVATQLPVVRPPRPLGAGTWGLTSYRPPSFGLGSIDVWYGYGGLHTRAIVNAGPIRLVLKR
jgi:hypothetical protein